MFVLCLHFTPPQKPKQTNHINNSNFHPLVSSFSYSIHIPSHTGYRRLLSFFGMWWIYIKNTACQSPNLFPLHSGLALTHSFLMCWNLAFSLLYFSGCIKKGAVLVFSVSYPSKSQDKAPRPRQCPICDVLATLHKAQCCSFWERIASNKASFGGWTNPGYCRTPGLPCWLWVAHMWAVQLPCRSRESAGASGWSAGRMRWPSCSNPVTLGHGGTPSL